MNICVSFIEEDLHQLNPKKNVQVVSMRRGQICCYEAEFYWNLKCVEEVSHLGYIN